MANAAQREKATIDLVINGQQSMATMRDLTAATVNARKALVNMAQTDPGYKAQEELLRKLMRAQQERIVKIHEEKTAWDKFKAGTGNIMAGVVGGNLVTTAVQKTLSIIPEAINQFRQYESASADMSANLGLDAKALEYFNQRARETGPAFGKSAAEMVEGYKLVGSANSDLIETPKLLEDVTQKAVTLSQASKMTLADASASLVGSMNQFDASADQAERYINVMAGGAQVGSAEIADMAMSLKASGIVAHQAGLSFEETNGALQSLSKESLKGEQAGTMFRNILLELQKGSNDTNPAVVGLDKALENLAKKNMSTAEAAKLFGKENVTAALSLINHRDRVAEFTKGLTGTTAAYDMAAKNNATLDHWLDVISAKLVGYVVNLGMKLAPALVKAAEMGSKFLDVLPATGEWLQKNGGWILSIFVPGLIAYQGAMIRATAATATETLAQTYRKVAYEVSFRWMVLQETATKAYALATGVLTGQISLQTAAVTAGRAAWTALNAVMRANPIGVVVTAVTALAWAVKLYSDNTEAALRIEREKVKLQDNIRKLTEQQTKAQQKYNDLLNEYPNLTQKERAELVKNIAMEKLHLESRIASMKAQERQMELLAAEPSLWQQVWAAIKAGATGKTVGTILTQQAVDNMKKVREQFQPGIDEMTKQLEGYEDMFKRIQKMETPVPKTGGGGNGDGNGKKGKKDKTAAELKKDVEQDANELEQALAAGRSTALDGVYTDYEKEVTAFAEKYSKMYKLADDAYDKQLKLAKGDKEKQRKASEEHEARLKEIRELSLVEMEAIDKKDAERQKKEQEKTMEFKLKAATDELELKKRTKLAEIAIAVGTGAMTEEEGKKSELQAEEVFLNAKKLLTESHFQSLLDLYKDFAKKKEEIESEHKTKSTEIDGDITENKGNQALAQKKVDDDTTKTETENAKKAFQKKKELFKDSTNVLKEYFTENTVIYKAAFAAQQAWALAEVAFNYSKAITAAIAAAAGLPFPANVLAFGKAIAIPTLENASAVANIRKQKFDVPGFALGGFTDQEPGGYVDKETYFSQGNFIAGEKGREWIMSAPMLKNPVFANLAGAMQAIQRTGGYRSVRSMDDLGLGGQQGNNAIVAAIGQLQAQLQMQLQSNQSHAESVATRTIEEIRQNKKLDFNFRTFEDYQESVFEVRSETTL